MRDSIVRLEKAAKAFGTPEGQTVTALDAIDLDVRRVGTWPDEVLARFATHATGGASKRLALKR